MRKRLIFLSALGLAGMALGQDNLIRNGDFEAMAADRPAAWGNYAGGGNARADVIADGRSGKALRIVDTDDKQAVGKVQDFAVEPGQSYIASVWARRLAGHGDRGVFLQIRLLPSGKIVQLELQQVPDDQFRCYQLQFAVPNGIEKAQMYLYSQNPSRAGMVIDDVAVARAAAGDAATLQYSTPGDAKAAAIAYPGDLTVAKLNLQSRPVVFFSAGEVAAARKFLPDSPAMQEFLRRQQQRVAPLMDKSDAELRALVPVPGTDIVYGLGMSADPAGERLRWAGWSDPFKVVGKDNVRYPNAQYPDDGRNGDDPAKKFHFAARANGFIFSELEEYALPALADCYMLTGEQKYAHVAAVLLDAIAPSYKANRRGPLDYPVSSSDYDRGGRLQRPYYQTARGLMNYVLAYDAILPSGELEKPSATAGRNIGENVARDLLWNGAVYCLGFAYDGRQLHNGHADYLRGAAAVGLLLNQPQLTALLFSDELGLPAMLATSVDRNGFYHESSHGYSQHCIMLYQSMADMYESAVRQQWPGVKSIYADPILSALLNRYADKLEVGGRLPMTGDDGPARAFASPLLRVPDPVAKGLDRGFVNQLENMWILLKRGATAEDRAAAARFLRNAYGERTLTPPADRRAFFTIGADDLDAIRQAPLDPGYFETASALYGAKGFGLIRGGRGEARHGIQFSFGPQLNHGQLEALSWTFYHHGGEWSYDPGYFNTHYRTGWTTTSVAHQQMTVNGTSVDIAAGGGELLAWQANNPSGIQYVMARQPGAFAGEGATRFERLIAQADNPDSGALEYWLDLGVTAGGKFRDDSFHTLFGQVEYNQAFTPTGAFSLFGDVAKDMKFQSDFRLSGYPDKGFYWKLPGEGYGLLLAPELFRGDAGVQARYSKSTLPDAERFQTTIKVDFPGESGREYYAVRSMAAPNAPDLPYLIRRDQGDAPSVFAKVVRFQPEGGIDPVAGVDKVALKGGMTEFCRAWLVRLTDGRSDLWLLGDGEQMLEAQAPGYPPVAADGRITVVRFDAAKTATDILSAAATAVKVDGKTMVSGGRAYRGKLEKVEDAALGKVRFAVAWTTPPSVETGCFGVVTSSSRGLPANWTGRELDGKGLELDDLRFVFSRFKVTPVAGKSGTYTCIPDLAQLYCAGGTPSTALARGKALRRDGKFIGYIQDAEATDKKLELKLVDLSGQPLALPAETMLEAGEALPGDTVSVLNNLRWRR